MCLMRPAAVDDRHFPGAAAFDPARWLAVMEMKMVVAMLLGGFEIEAVATPDGGEPVEHLALTMSPVGLTLRLRPRI